MASGRLRCPCALRSPPLRLARGRAPSLPVCPSLRRAPVTCRYAAPPHPSGRASLLRPGPSPSLAMVAHSVVRGRLAARSRAAADDVSHPLWPRRGRTTTHVRGQGQQADRSPLTPCVRTRDARRAKGRARTHTSLPRGHQGMRKRAPGGVFLPVRAGLAGKDGPGDHQGTPGRGTRSWMCCPGSPGRADRVAGRVALDAGWPRDVSLDEAPSKARS